MKSLNPTGKARLKFSFVLAQRKETEKTLNTPRVLHREKRVLIMVFNLPGGINLAQPEKNFLQHVECDIFGIRPGRTIRR